MAAHQRIPRSPASPRAVVRLGVAAVLLIVAAGCTGSTETSGSASGGAADRAPNAAAAAPKTVPQASGSLQSRDVVRTATLDMRTADVDRAADAVVRLGSANQGRVDLDQRTTTNGRRTAEVVLRVPPPTLEAVIGEIDSLGTETSRSVRGEDVTASKADIGARVSTLAASVKRLQGFLAHSGSISDLVSLESQLTQREGDLESTQAQQKALSDQIALATLTVDLTMRATPARAAGGPAGFGSALAGGWHALVVSLRWILAALGYVAPAALVIALAAVGAVVFRRRRRRHKAAAAG